MKTNEKCGHVAIVGRPNVGKSTLVNDLVGQKISIVTPKPQTTRSQILGVKTLGSVQAVYIDTPGLHQTEQRAMNRYMNRLASAVIMDADVVVFMVEATRWHEDDETVLEKLKHVTVPIILVINKIDLVKDKSRLLPFINRVSERASFAAIVPISAKKHEQVDELEKIIMNFLPEGPHLFPDDQITDRDERFQAAELIREKLIQLSEQELPYSTTVVVESLKLEDTLLSISAIIWVEREGQKPIVIGKDGALLKKIGTLARKDIEKLFNVKVFLRLWVKVKSDWTNNERLLQGLGFG